MLGERASLVTLDKNTQKQVEPRSFQENKHEQWEEKGSGV